ncbi:MAG TPA: radical SAM protein [Planctomycetota bacterium]|nr:radical SAM protein [Planctomycetota bacterium]
MVDGFGRQIDYLRISVTDRCNLRCRYCMPAGGVKLLPHDQILSLEEIVEVARAAVPLGITKVRLTGGEPLVRDGITELVRMLSRIEGIRDLTMTTNGVLLGRRARRLADAGLQRVNVSLDALDSDRYREITGGGDVCDVLEGIDAARSAGLAPVKLNCVVSASADEPDARAVSAFARDNGLAVRFIHRMDLSSGTFAPVEGGSGGHCATCSRLRLSSDGQVRPCLFSDLAFSVRQLGPEQALLLAIRNKPKSGGPCSHNWMHGIGG